MDRRAKRAGAVGLILCGTWAGMIEAKSPVITSKAPYQDSATEAILREADRVEIFLVKEGGRSGETPFLGGYPIVGQAGQQGHGLAKRLAGLLLDPKHYQLRPKDCEFDPGFGFRMWKGKHSRAVLICLTCDEVEVVDEHPAGAVAKDPSKVVFHGGSEPMRPALVKLAKSLFPHERGIQGLKETR